MKYVAILLLSCLSVLGQSPLLTGSGIDWTKAPSGNPDYTATLYVDLQTDTTASLGAAYNQGDIVTWWTNIAPFNPNVTLAIYSATTSSGIWPYRTNNITPTGKPAVEFVKNNNTSTQPIITAAGSNQPNTVIMVVREKSTDQSYFDCPSGSRTLLKNISGGGNGYQIFCGSVININDGIVQNQFYILTFVLNGASSYMRTNGVKVTTFNPGANGIGQIKFGNDNTLVTAYTGEIAAFRIYQEAMSTNNLHIAEQNLATRYTGATLPSP
jgi:hypothetical protein